MITALVPQAEGTVIHYTLNTGYAIESPRSGVSREAVEALQTLVESGGPIPGCDPFQVAVAHGSGFTMFTVWRGSEPAVACAVAWTVDGQAEAWPAIEKLYLDLSDTHPQLLAPGKEASKPESLPWLVVLVLPFIVNQELKDVSWYGDFERCFAWTILGERARAPH